MHIDPKEVVYGRLDELAAKLDRTIKFLNPKTVNEKGCLREVQRQHGDLLIHVYEELAAMIRAVVHEGRTKQAETKQAETKLGE